MKPIRWIIGYVDSQGAVFAHVVREGDAIDSHLQRWPGRVSAHGKWRWAPDKPYSLNTYGEDIDDEDMYRVMERVEKLREIY